MRSSVPYRVTTTASRRPSLWTDWRYAAAEVFVAVLGVVGAYFALPIVWAALTERSSTGPRWDPAVVVLSTTMLLAGGSVAAVRIKAECSTVRLAAGLLVPLPTAVVALVLLAAMGRSQTDLRAEMTVAAGLYGLVTVGYLATAGVRWARHQRSNDSLRLAPRVDAELDRATQGGRAIEVIREYLDDEDGRVHLDSDTEALADLGYQLLGVDRPVGVVAALRPIADLVCALFGWGPDDGPPRLVATFRRRSSPR